MAPCAETQVGTASGKKKADLHRIRLSSAEDTDNNHKNKLDDIIKIKYGRTRPKVPQQEPALGDLELNLTQETPTLMQVSSTLGKPYKDTDDQIRDRGDTHGTADPNLQLAPDYAAGEGDTRKKLDDICADDQAKKSTILGTPIYGANFHGCQAASTRFSRSFPPNPAEEVRGTISQTFHSGMGGDTITVMLTDFCVVYFAVCDLSLVMIKCISCPEFSGQKCGMFIFYKAVK